MLAPHELRLGDRKLEYVVGTGNGPPLLLLHGVTRQWQDFAPIVPVLLPRWQVFALNFRGHGGSTAGNGRYLVTDFVDDARALLEEVIAAPTVLFGHSLGALAALGVAARRPALARAVVLEDPPSPRLALRIRETPFFALFSAMKGLAGKTRSVAETARLLAEVELPQGEGKPTVRFGDIRDATSIRFSARCLQDLDPEALTQLLEGQWLAGFDWDSTLRAVRCPALLLCGDVLQGGMLPLPEAQEAAALMADCSLVQVRGAGHLLHWLAAEATARYVLGFLESLA